MRFILEIFYDDFQKRKVAIVYFYQKQSNTTKTNTKVERK